MVLRNVGILSCGKMLAAVGFGIGLALAAFLSVVAVGAAVLQHFTSRVGPQETLHTLGAVFFFPVLYGLMGFAAGVVGAFSFNLASRRLGGIEIDLTPPAQ